MKNFGGCSSIFQQLWNYFCARLRVLYWRVKRGFPNFPQTIRFCQLGLFYFGDWLILPAIGAEWRVNHGNKKWLATHLKMSQDGTLQQKGLYCPVYIGYGCSMSTTCRSFTKSIPKCYQPGNSSSTLAHSSGLTGWPIARNVCLRSNVTGQVGPWHTGIPRDGFAPRSLGRATLAASLAQITYEKVVGGRWEYVKTLKKQINWGDVAKMCGINVQNFVGW